MLCIGQTIIVEHQVPGLHKPPPKMKRSRPCYRAVACT